MTLPIDTVTALYQAFGRGDVPALLALLSPDVRWTFDGSTGEPYMRTAHGRDDVARWLQQVAARDGIEQFEPRRLLAGPDHVTVIGWERTRALPDGGTFESNWVHVWELQAGLVTRFFGMFDSAAAARARG